MRVIARLLLACVFALPPMTTASAADVCACPQPGTIDAGPRAAVLQLATDVSASRAAIGKPTPHRKTAAAGVLASGTTLAAATSPARLDGHHISGGAGTRATVRGRAPPHTTLR